MSLTTTIVAASALSAANLLLLAVLTVVWANNYRRFRSSLVLGLLAFSVVLAIENLVAVYFFFSSDMLYASDPSVERVVALLRALQFVALSFLVVVTLR